MSYTNTTSHYGLPQYVATDKPKYLTDFNETMSAIDTQMYTNAQAAATADGKAVSAQNTADVNTSSISTLNTQINGDSSDPSDTGLAGDVSALEGSVNTINSLIGNGEPTTTDKTIIGAINELAGDLDDKLDASRATGKYAITSHHAQVYEANDGTITIGQQMAALVTKIKAVAANLADDEFIRVTGGFIHTAFSYPMYAEDYTKASNNINVQMTTVNVNTVPNSADFFTAYLNESACKLYGGTFGGTMSDTWTEESATVASSTAILYYDVYKAI